VVNLTVAAMRLSAHCWLRSLHQDVGVAGLAAAATLPGLMAMIDQHAAAVREDTTLGMEHSASVAGVVLLAHYGRGVLAEARRHGWRAPQPGQWHRADWASVRLAAVSALAQTSELPPDLPPCPGSPTADQAQ
jgi:hypothetical protein